MSFLMSAEGDYPFQNERKWSHSAVYSYMIGWQVLVGIASGQTKSDFSEPPPPPLDNKPTDTLLSWLLPSWGKATKSHSELSVIKLILYKNQESHLNFFSSPTKPWLVMLHHLKELVVPYLPTRALRSLNAGLLVVPRVLQSRMGAGAFRYQAPPLLWNQLPPSVWEAVIIIQEKKSQMTLNIS